MSSTPARPEPAFRGFPVEVARVRRLSPSFLRMTFTGADLAHFGDTGLDQRIKLVLPAGCAVPLADFSGEDWFVAWRSRPAAERETLRTYTVRAVRRQSREVDVDVVLHGVAPGAVTTRGCGLADLLGCTCSAPAGPAVRWCAAARSGDPIVLVGPNARYEGPPSGIEWRPPVEATRYLLAGDETAVPAVCAILESLPAEATGHALLEVPTAHDRLQVRAPAGVTVRWLPREPGVGPSGPASGALDHGTALVAGVRAAIGPAARAGRPPSPPNASPPNASLSSSNLPATLEAREESDVLPWFVPADARAPDGWYAWVAGEAAVVRDLRRFLLREVGLDRRAVAAMGYWRAGRAEAA